MVSGESAKRALDLAFEITKEITRQRETVNNALKIYNVRLRLLFFSGIML